MLTVNDALIPATNMISVRYRDRAQVVGYHAAILSALRARDAEAAVAAFDGLIAYLSEVYDRALAARVAAGGRATPA
jgi:DNA-binding GntR family transcriptional regulator